MLDLSDFPELDYILRQESFVVIIDGKRGDGKTDFSFLLNEYTYEKGYRQNIKTNVSTESYMVSYLDNKPDLDAWLLTKGMKTYYLDEAGTILKKMRFMANINLDWLDIIQLLRKYKCGFIGSMPTKRLVDSGLLDTDIYDAHIHKDSKTIAFVNDNLNQTTYTINNIPRTSIKFDTRWIARFHTKKIVPLEGLQLCCKVAKLYSESGTYEYVKLKLPEVKHDEQVRRLLRDHCAHTIDSQLTP